MASKDEHKRELMRVLALILYKDDDLCPDIPTEGDDYKRWDQARNELAQELQRRGDKKPILTDNFCEKSAPLPCMLDAGHEGNCRNL